MIYYDQNAVVIAVTRRSVDFAELLLIQGGPKSRPLSKIIIKLYYKPPLRLDFA